VTGVAVYPAKRELNADERIADCVLPLIGRMKGIKHLWLGGCKLPGGWSAHLRRADQLEFLDLSHSSVVDADIENLGGLQRLTMLDLSYTSLTDAGFESLSTLKNLEHLDASNTQMADRGAFALAALPQLKILKLMNCQITDAVVTQLLKKQNLENYALSGTLISFDMATKLQRYVMNVRARTHRNQFPDRSPDSFANQNSALAAPVESVLDEGRNEKNSLRRAELERNAETESKDSNLQLRSAAQSQLKWAVDGSILNKPLDDDVHEQKRRATE